MRERQGCIVVEQRVVALVVTVVVHDHDAPEQAVERRRCDQHPPVGERRRGKRAMHHTFDV
jgi:hypothetical protein